LFGARDLDISGSILFSTAFPGIEDIKLIVASGVSTLYFFDKPNDPDTVRLLNDLPNILETIRLF